MSKSLVKSVSVSWIILMLCTTASAKLTPFYEQSNDEWYCGYKNDIGEIVIPIKKYEHCGDFSEGLAYVGEIARPLVEVHSGYKYLQGFIDETGNLVIPIEHEVLDGALYTDFKSFSEGLVAIYRNGKYGYMNKQRELVIPYKYQDAQDFKNGLAIVVNQNDKYGAINRLGNVVIPFKFNYLSSFSDGLALYTEDNHWNEGFQYGFVDLKGNISIKAKWDSACLFSEGLAAVRVGDSETGKWGIIDKAGNFLVKPEYDAPQIQTWSDADYDDCYYKKGKMDMYKYTNPEDPYESSITRYTLNHNGSILAKKFYSNWNTIIDEFIKDNGL